MKQMTARVFRGLEPEQMVACGGQRMPVDARGENLKGLPFNAWVNEQVRAYREAQVESLSKAERALQASLAEAQRMVALFTQQLERNAERRAEILARKKV